MGLNINYIEGQTPLSEDEQEGLKISSITTREELDEFEQLNIEKAIQWTFGKKLKAEQLFSEKFIKDLHKRMYGEVWKWAGTFRTSEKNIGIKSLVSIHCFANGNGRHSRLMADLIMEKLYNEKIFSWGSTNLVKATETRTAYIKAVKKADQQDLLPLIAFAKS